MAKIHVRGGSPLRLAFEDDERKPLAVRLEPIGPTGEYWVMNEATNPAKKLQTYQQGNENIFREANPDKKSCEVMYLEKEPDTPRPITASAASEA